MKVASDLIGSIVWASPDARVWKSLALDSHYLESTIFVVFFTPVDTWRL
jgi:hypothetical protein